LEEKFKMPKSEIKAESAKVYLERRLGVQVLLLLWNAFSETIGANLPPSSNDKASRFYKALRNYVPSLNQMGIVRHSVWTKKFQHHSPKFSVIDSQLVSDGLHMINEFQIMGLHVYHHPPTDPTLSLLLRLYVQTRFQRRVAAGQMLVNNAGNPIVPFDNGHAIQIIGLLHGALNFEEDGVQDALTGFWQNYHVMSLRPSTVSQRIEK
jgi:hypothetical protein